MKKTIEGVEYDTQKAKVLAFADSGGKPVDLQYWQEVLYQKPTGEYFLMGIGGPMSKYAVMRGGFGWSASRKINPLSEQEVKEWCEQNLSEDQYKDLLEKMEDRPQGN